MSRLSTLVLFVLLIACSNPTPAPVPTATPPTQATSIAAPGTVAPTFAAQLTNLPPPTATQVARSTQPATAVPAVPTTPTEPVNPTPVASGGEGTKYEYQEFAVPTGTHPHDVAPAADGGIWYTAQAKGALGYLDVKTGATRHIPLGGGSAPHGVILGPDNAPWITDGGLNAIVRVDPTNDRVDVYRLPASHPNANLNTAVFDKNGVLWFTGQNGVYGKLDPQVGVVEAWSAPRGRGPYGITAAPNGDVYYASLAGSHIARVNPQTNEATVIKSPTVGQGARRVWSDSQGRIWVSEWNAGQVGMYDPASDSWKEWKLPGARPQTYAVYVDENDKVWLSDFGGNALVRFDPASENFEVYPLPSAGAAVRQILGRAGEVWGAESGVDKLIVGRASQE